METLITLFTDYAFMVWMLLCSVFLPHLLKPVPATLVTLLTGLGVLAYLWNAQVPKLIGSLPIYVGIVFFVGALVHEVSKRVIAKRKHGATANSP
jgi:hypothetical protein